MSTLTERPERRRWNRTSRFASALLVVWSLLPRSTAAQEADVELLLVALRVDHEILADSILAYPQDGSVLLPLGELSHLLQFGISVDLRSQTAKGFFLSETRQFRLDVEAGQVEVEGVTHPLPRRKVLVLDDDIYVEASLLAAWFPFDAHVDLFGAMVTLKPREKLPYQVRRDREREIERALAGLRPSGDLPAFVPNPYRRLARPFVDQHVRLGHAGGTGGPSMQYATLATGDLLGCEASLFVSGSDRRLLGELRSTLGRRDPDGRLLGFLRAREVMAGDVLLPGNDLVTVSARGNGAVIANVALQRAFSFDQQTLDGELPPGWEVELYLNGALIGFQRRDDGRYEFRNVPVLYGLNVFRLLFHGPRGERRQKIETYNIGETLTPKGELQYRAGSAAPDAQAARAVAEMAYGVTRRLSVTASAVRLGSTGASGAQQYATAGVRTAWRRLFAYADLGSASDGGKVARAGLQTRLGGVAVTLTRSELQDGYASETYPAFLGFIASRTTLRLGGTIRSASRFPFPVTLDLQRDALAAGGTVVRIGGLISTSIRRTWISHRLEGALVREVTSPLAGEDNVTGALLVSRSLRGMLVRGELGYEVIPRRRPTTATVLVEWPRARNLHVSAELSRNATSGISRVVARLRRDHGPVGVTVALDVPSRGSPSVQLELTTSLIPNPLSRRVQFRGRPAAASGAVTARVFLDRNNNGIRDDGEPPIENAGFFVNRSSVSPTTNAGGIVMLDYLPVHAPTDVQLSTSTLEDPWWVPSRPAVRMIPRPGKALVVDFPIAVSGEITGTVALDSGKGPRPAGRIRMQVVSGAGAVISESMSDEYDGFYDLTLIPPGTYTLRVHPEDVATFRLSSDAAQRVVITVEKNVLNGVDVKLTR